MNTNIYKTITLPVVLDGCETVSMTLKDVHSVWEQGAEGISGLNRDEVGGWRKLYN
jgi:hypothetical protein